MSTRPISRVVVVGAGALGSVFAARLGQAGARVGIVERDRVRAGLIAEHGITLVDETGSRAVPVDVLDPDGDLGSADLVLLFTKTLHSRAALQAVSSLADGNCLALTLQNGLGNEEPLSEVFTTDRTLFGVTDVPADLRGPTEAHTGGSGRIWLGGASPSAHAASGAVASLLCSAGFHASADDDVRPLIWAKAAFNAALSSLSTVLRISAGEMNRPEGRRIVSAVIDETCRTAAALGIHVDGSAIEARVDEALVEHADHRPSMLRDREAGRATEIETINGAIERYAKSAGVEVPVTSTLADLVRIGEPDTSR